MSKRKHWSKTALATWLGLSVVVVASCFPEGYPDQLKPIVPAEAGVDGGQGGQGGSDDGSGGDDEPFECLPADSPEPLKARSAVMSADAASGSQLVFVNDLFQTFKAYCGGCHVDSNAGEFQVTAGTFAIKVDEKSIERMMSNEDEGDNAYMPPDPVGKAWKDRSSDAITSLVSLLQTWIDVGRPADVFTVDTSSSAESAYLMTPEVGSALTNVGNCVPDKLFYVSPKSDDLDDFFAGLEKKPPGQGSPEERIGLPPTLEQTDLFSFDSTILAQHGVIAYAPTYPLWSDGSGKLRHVRVPRGKSIEYDREAREFSIPDNTRFYKTFLKKVIDRDGNEGFRKIETRLIVVRQDTQNDDGSAKINALYGSYAWNDDETTAELVTDPLRNGEPFRDRLFTYIADEQGAEAVKQQDPPPPNLAFALESAGVTRHYAIPGGERCVQCHMGSPSSSFVLGFTPLQVHRLPEGEQGVFEPTGPDELTQLERLIDYGVITGLDLETDVVLLEDSQGDRKPRNQQELKAQAYMLGNCAHCHNPRGYPSAINPALAPLLDFFPRQDGGGIFQFPLERFSPRTSRGPGGDVPIPYITPSLRDVIPAEPALLYTPKYEKGATIVEYIDAPWRSLIYRNVDSPFTYADDYAIFPHMPMNTAGFDCRAPRILGEWMVSVPAVRKNAGLLESVTKPVLPDDETADNSPQPYVEVPPDDARFQAAVADAALRLEDYRNGERYGYCPDTSDITDPAILRGQQTVPKDELLYLWDDEIENPDPRFFDPRLLMSIDGIPDRAHYVISDFTEVPGDWSPRRTDFIDVLRDDKFPTVNLSDAVAVARQEAEKQVVSLLKTITLEPEIVSFAVAERPMGFWQQPEDKDCDFSSVRKLSDIPEAERDPWMASGNEDSPVFEEPPGASIFTAICVNCHGRNLDAQGIQAKTVADLTGGVARVANFRTGLFGPEGSPDGNRDRVFGEFATSEVTSDDWAARYTTWMGLGGTIVRIPDTVLNLVARTPVLGHNRKNFEMTATPNMLAVAQDLCRFTLPHAPSLYTVSWSEFTPWLVGLYSKTALLTEIGDARLWMEVCALDNPPPVRVLQVADNKLRLVPNTVLHGRAEYPVDAPVGNHLVEIERGLQDGNLFPWCIANDANGQAFAAEHQLGGQNLPLCPGGLVGLGDALPWQQRGAINAGLMVYLYVDQVVRGEITPRYYDRCEELGQ